MKKTLSSCFVLWNGATYYDFHTGVQKMVKSLSRVRMLIRSKVSMHVECVDVAGGETE